MTVHSGGGGGGDLVAVQPDGCRALADALQAAAEEAGDRRQRIASILAEGGESAPLMELRLESVEQWAGDLAVDLRWRVDAMVALDGGSADGGAMIAGAWPASRDRTLDLVRELDELAGDPAAVRTWWSERSAGERAALSVTSPHQVGNTDGIPFADRDVANRRLVADHLEELRQDLGQAETRLVEATDDFWDGWVGFNRDIDDAEAEVLRLERAIAAREQWLSDDLVTVIGYDTSGDGRAIVAIGDLDAATEVAVVVPGITNTLNNFHGLAGNATELRNEMVRRDRGGEPVTVAWLGYDTPIGDSILDGNPLEAAQSEKANEGASLLQQFTHELARETPEAAALTIIGHSYGSTVSGLAARGDVDADRLVMIGSPGSSASLASDYTIDESGVYAARAPDDPIRHVYTASSIPDSIALGNWSGLGPPPVDLERFGQHSPHGTDPVWPGFGAQVFETEGASGHSEYFEPQSESLKNLAIIATGGDPTLVAVEE